jgi:predicted RNA-binding protein
MLRKVVNDMCEFKVFLGGEKVAEDVVYAKQDKEKVVLRDIIGSSLTFDEAEIIEVDVMSTRLVLEYKN